MCLPGSTSLSSKRLRLGWTSALGLGTLAVCLFPKPSPLGGAAEASGIVSLVTYQHQQVTGTTGYQVGQQNGAGEMEGEAGLGLGWELQEVVAPADSCVES